MFWVFLGFRSLVAIFGVWGPAVGFGVMGEVAIIFRAFWTMLLVQEGFRF